MDYIRNDWLNRSLIFVYPIEVQTTYLLKLGLVDQSQQHISNVWSIKVLLFDFWFKHLLMIKRSNGQTKVMIENKVVSN